MAYALLQKTLTAPPVDRLRRACAAVGGLTDGDAAFLAKNAFGVLISGLPLERAHDLQAALKAEGVETDVADQEDLRLPAPMGLKRAACQVDGFVAYDALGRPKTIPWNQVILVAGGTVDVVEVKRVEQRLPYYDISRGGNIAAIEFSDLEQRKQRLVLEVFVDSAPARYQIAGRQFGYGYLGQRLRGSAAENFVLLVRDLLQYAGQAGANRGAMAILADPPATFAYPSRRAFEEEIIWLIWNARHRPVAENGK